MSAEYREHLRSLGFARHRGGTKRTEVLKDDTGTPAGFTVEHWDDHVDATCTHPEVQLNPNLVHSSKYEKVDS